MFELTDIITVWDISDVDAFGAITWGSPSHPKARTSNSSQKFTDQNGDTQMSKSIAYTGGNVSLTSMVYFGESSSATPATGALDVKAVIAKPDGSGLKKVFF